MKNFIIFFEEKEGTSPLVRLLDNLNQISIVHQINDKGWEPFDEHNCGPMSNARLFQCLHHVYAPRSRDMTAVNTLYTATAVRPLETIEQNASVGFKMRFKPPVSFPLNTPIIPGWNKTMKKLFADRQFFAEKFTRQFKTEMIEFLKEHDIFVFIVVRQDIFRWALSKYHGDGQGGSGHLQFKLASGQISRDEIGSVAVDCDRLSQILEHCEASHIAKRELMEDFKASGVACAPLRYEDFLKDKPTYFQEFGHFVGQNITPDDVAAAIEKGAYFEKVHSNDISEFVQNHEEVMDRFGNRFFEWA